MSIEKDRLELFEHLDKLSDQNRGSLKLKRVVSKLKDAFPANQQDGLKLPAIPSNSENALDPPYIFN